jgi:hypothetical protein
MTTNETTPSLSQLVSAAGLTGPVSRDEAAKIPGEIEGMIARTDSQLEAVTGQLASLYELERKIDDAIKEKAKDFDRIKRTLAGLHDARAAIAKP